MVYVYTVLFFVSILFFFVGIVYPPAVVFGIGSPTRPQVAFGYALAALIFLFGIGFTAPPRTPELAPIVAAPSAHLMLVPRSWELDRPEVQVAYLAAIHDARDQYEAASNALKKSAIKRSRQKATEAALGNGANWAYGWIGTLERVGTTRDGRAYLTVRIAPDITFRTINNAILGDFSTLISAENPVYDQLAELSRGDTVKFTGGIRRETSITERGGMTEPAFFFYFKNIAKWDGAI